MSWIFVADDGEQVHYETPPEVAKLEAERSELLRALIIGGRECAELEFGKDNEHIDRLALATWNGWLKEALNSEEG